MSEVRNVFAQISPNQVCEGFYTFDGKTLTMVQADGSPVLLDDEPVTAIIPKGDNPVVIAKVLTKRIRRTLRGEQVEGFWAVIEYPRSAVA